MDSSKIRLWSRLLTFGFGVLVVWVYLAPKQAERSLETPTSPLTKEVKVFNETPPELQAETDALLPLFDLMTPVPVYLKDEPILKSGTNTETGVAYTHCENHELPSIFVKKSFYQKANRKQLVNALKHELTHAWLCRQGLMSAGHDALFRRKFSQIGGVGN